MSPSTKTDTSIKKAIENFVSATSQKNANTGRAYQNGLAHFLKALDLQDIDPRTQPAARLTPEHVLPLIDNAFFDKKSGETHLLDGLARNTKNLYMRAVIAFYEFVRFELGVPVDVLALKHLTRRRLERPKKTHPQTAMAAIDRLLEYVDELKRRPAEQRSERLVDLRDRAFIWALAETGLRVNEACSLQRGDINFDTYRADIEGKGGKSGVIRFGEHAMVAIQEYLAERHIMDENTAGLTNTKAKNLPLFTRHDPAAKGRSLPMSTNAGRDIVRNRVVAALGEDFKGRITPHSLRHYFVTSIMESTGNIRLAQLLARHSNITTTTIYAELTDAELDRAHHETFDK